MTKEQMIVAIVVAIIGVIGTSVGSVFAYIQFSVKRKDEKEEKNVQKRIDEAVKKAKEEMREEFERGLLMRGEEGRKRFDINSKAIEENTAQISKLTDLVADQVTKLDKFADSMTSLNAVVRASAESQRNSNYDRILIVANKVLKSNRITITEKTNLKQLYSSWKELKGDDPKIDTIYEECMKIPPVPDEDM